MKEYVNILHSTRAGNMRDFFAHTSSFIQLKYKIQGVPLTNKGHRHIEDIIIQTSMIIIIDAAIQLDLGHEIF